jgi:hypothetical protein
VSDAADRRPAGIRALGACELLHCRAGLVRINL